MSVPGPLAQTRDPAPPPVVEALGGLTPAERAEEAEILDREGLDPALVERALGELERVNRLLLGYRPVLRTLLPRLAPRRSAAAAGAPEADPLLLDVGTGSGDVVRHLARAAGRRGRRVRVLGVDRKLGHLLAGRRRERRLGGGGGLQLRVVADARALPLADGAVDWSVSSLFFHHFEAADNLRILAEMRRAARRGAVVVDLRRSRFGAAVGRLLIPLTGAGFITRHDGRVSLGRAWPLARVRTLIADQPVEELRRRFPFRFSLVLAGSGRQSSA
jgi:SAM-dependent methyltransferase